MKKILVEFLNREIRLLSREPGTDYRQGRRDEALDILKVLDEIEAESNAQRNLLEKRIEKLENEKASLGQELDCAILTNEELKDQILNYGLAQALLELDLAKQA